MTKKIEIIKHDYHRIGWAGAPFDVLIFKDKDNDATMLGVVFEEAFTVAVFDLDLLSQHIIEFGENSWDCDDYEQALREAIDREE